MQETKRHKTMKNHVLFFAFFQSAVREANSQQRSRRKALVSSCLRGQSFRLSSAALWPPCLRGISFHFSVVHPLHRNEKALLEASDPTEHLREEVRAFSIDVATRNDRAFGAAFPKISGRQAFAELFVTRRFPDCKKRVLC